MPVAVGKGHRCHSESGTGVSPVTWVKKQAMVDRKTLILVRDAVVDS